MATDLDVKFITTIKAEIMALEKEIARGQYKKLRQLSFLQGRLAGLEEAIVIIHQIVMEKEDKL